MVARTEVDKPLSVARSVPRNVIKDDCEVGLIADARTPRRCHAMVAWFLNYSLPDTGMYLVHD